jgi:hypothetical protein
VKQTFDETDVGYFCFLDQAENACGNTDTTRRPYSTPTELTSIDGTKATYCLPPSTTTCPGIRDTRNIPCTTNDDCGVDGLTDGYCPTSGTGAGLCTYLCGGGADCASPSLVCGGSPQHCRP